MSRLGLGTLIVAALAAAPGCTIRQSSTPDLFGPSDFALALNVTATPDSLALDGGSKSSVVVEARDESGGPKPGVSFRLDIFNGQVAQDCGTLSARNVVTGSDGLARATFTAPSMPLPYPECANFTPGNVVTIVATPTGTNFQTANVRTATIRLVPTGVILPPASTPTALFTFAPAGPAANSPVTFNASTSCGTTLVAGACLLNPSTSGIVSFSWDFGDGTSGSGLTTTHTFALAQTYNVTLTVTSDRGVSSSRTLAVTVGAGLLPTASFSFSPTAPIVGQVVTFNASASTPGAGHTIAQYTWVFGDGVSKTGMIVTHDFDAAGTYSVSLTVTDERGQKATTTLTVPVGGVVTTPKAAFGYSPASPVQPPRVVTFDASASSASNGTTIVTYTWDFGDLSGTLVTSSSGTTHTYGAAGTFTISLTVTDSLGQTNTTTRPITIQ